MIGTGFDLQRESLDEGAVQVKIGEAKSWLRLIGEEEDPLLKRVLEKAHDDAEDAFNRALRRATWVLSYDNVVPGAVIEIPRPPFVEVVNIEKWDTEENEWTTVPEEDYVVRKNVARAEVFPANGKSWPRGPIRIRYKAGYANEGAPRSARDAILELTAWGFEHRGEEPTAPGVGGSTGRPPDIRKRYPSLVVPWI